MKLPSKIISFRESSLSKLPVLLEVLKENNLSPYELYEETRNKFENIGEFIDVLDYLYALEKITFDEEGRRIVYVM